MIVVMVIMVVMIMVIIMVIMEDYGFWMIVDDYGDFGGVTMDYLMGS